MEQPTEQLLQTLWAKTGQEGQTHLLIYHLIDVAEVAYLLWENALGAVTCTLVSQALGLPEEPAGRFLTFVVGLHDLGKASPAFQRKHEPIMPQLREQGLPFGFGQLDIPHGVVTTVALGYRGSGLLSNSDLIEDRRIAEALARIIGGHHGVWPSVGQMRDAYDAAHQPEWKMAREALFNALRRLYDPPALSDGLNASAESFNAFLMLVSGFTTIADWIGSMSEYFPLKQGWVPLESYRQKAQEQAKQALRATGWLKDHLEASSIAFPQLLPDAKAEPNPVQQIVLACTRELTDQSLIVLEAPTGIGKTEMAFYLSNYLLDQEGLQGLYVAMPTQATSNQMHSRTTRFLHIRYPNRTLQPRLLHSQAIWQIDEQLPAPSGIFDDEKAGRAAVLSNWFRSNKKRGLLEPFAVGTVDQALLSVLWTRHFFVRLFGLRNKVLIFDEVHAYDTYMNELFMILLVWLRWLGSSIIILSATLPNSARRRLVEQFCRASAALDETDSCNARLTLVSASGQTHVVSLDAATRQRIIRVGWIEADELTTELENATHEGGCVAVICNTVRRAQEIYRELQAAQANGLLAGCDLDLFHARFPAAWRQHIEIETTQRFGRDGPRPQRAILVATQVVEQSLDLDFDLIITELPPIDLLIQRVGRLHRHHRDLRPALLSEPRALIVKPDLQDNLPAFGDSEYIYGRFLLLASWATLQSRDSLRLPDQSRELIETVYGEGWQALPWHDALAQTQADYRAEQNDSQYQAGLKHIPPPDTTKLLDGQNTGLDEEDPTLHEAFRALTRLIEPTIQVICMHRVGAGYSLELDGSEPIRLDHRPDPRRLLLYVVSIAHRGVFRALSESPEYSLPEAWAGEAALKHHRKAIFENGLCWVPGTGFTLRLSREYGLEILKEDEL